MKTELRKAHEKWTFVKVPENRNDINIQRFLLYLISATVISGVFCCSFITHSEVSKTQNPLYNITLPSEAGTFDCSQSGSSFINSSLP